MLCGTVPLNVGTGSKLKERSSASTSITLIFLFLFLFVLTLAVLQQPGLVGQPLRHGRHRGSTLPAAIFGDQEGDVTRGGEEAHRGLQLIAETTHTS